MAVLLAAFPDPAAAGCRLHPAALHRASSGAAVTVLHPRPGPQDFIASMCRDLTRTPGLAVVPAGGPASLVGTERTPAERLERAVRALVFLESRGIHADPAGRVVTSTAAGSPMGYLQVSHSAARSAARTWARLSLPGAAELADPTEPARLRRDWTWNLRLGALHLLALAARVPRAREDGELAWLRILAAYVGGERPDFVRAPEDAFLRGAAARPELRRYLRQGAFVLGLGLTDTARARWPAALAGRLTRVARGWDRERARVMHEFEALYTPCP